MAVHQTVSAEAESPLLPLPQLTFADGGVQQDRRRGRKRACIHQLATHTEPLAMGVIIVLPLAEVQVEDVPANPLTDGSQHDRGVADECAAVDRKVSSGHVCASLTVCGMLPACVHMTVPPGPMMTSVGEKAGVGASAMATAAVAAPPGNDPDDAVDGVQPTDIVVRAEIGKCMDEGCTIRQDPAVEGRSPPLPTIRCIKYGTSMSGLGASRSRTTRLPKSPRLAKASISCT
jgi:hypothetical protein